jgi:hypothetical protein
MRKLSFVVFAAAILAVGLFGGSGKATPVAAPSAIGVATTDTGLVQKAAVVCGYYGCVRTYPRYYGYYRPYGYYGGYYGRPYGYYGRRW